MFGKHHTQKSIAQISETMKNSKCHAGAKNGKAKTYLVISPDGQKYKITGALKAFCIEHKIWYARMLDISKNRRDSYKGWVCKQIEKGVDV